MEHTIKIVMEKRVVDLPKNVENQLKLGLENYEWVLSLLFKRYLTLIA